MSVNIEYIRKKLEESVQHTMFSSEEHNITNKAGKLREKDVKRQEEIIKYLGCSFYRIKELTTGIEVVDCTQSKIRL